MLPFTAVSNRFRVPVWITVFDRFGHCLNLFQSITKHWSSGATFFGIRSVSRAEGPFDYIYLPFIFMNNSSIISDVIQ